MVAKEKPILMTQQDAVRKAMSNGDWWTLFSLRRCLIARHGVYAAETSISARIRDLRHEGKSVERRQQSGHKGVYEYRVFK